MLLLLRGPLVIVTHNTKYFISQLRGIKNYWITSPGLQKKFLKIINVF